MTRASAGNSSHPDEDTLERYATGELSSEEHARITAHAATCPDCAAVLDALTLLRRGAASFDGGAPRPERRSWTVPAIAATVLLAVAIPAALYLRDRAAPSSSRQAAPDVAVAITPSGTLSSSPPQFTWRPMAGATRYEITLFRDDGTRVWTEKANGTSLTPPQPLGVGRYYWRVRGVGADDSHVDAPLTRFEIR
jgi:anti-sigma factor ChrR (cupin superfamily)